MWRCLLAAGVLLFSLAGFAQEAALQEQRYVVDIELQTADDFGQLLNRAEQLLLAGVELPEGGTKVTFILHGPVLKSLLRRNYLDNKPLVDLAASLSAMHVIDLKACNTWLNIHGLQPQELQPFVETVSYGPAEVERLVREEEYVHF